MTVTQIEGVSLLGLPLSVWGQRYLSKVVQYDVGCWGWTGSTREGYGRLGLNSGQGIDAHRLSWLLHHGPIPSGLHVLHTCDNPPCTRPDHLFVGSRSTNMQDMHAKGRQGSNRVRGDQHPQAKAIPEAEIHRLRALGLTQSAIASVVGISQSHVSKVLRGVHRV